MFAYKYTIRALDFIYFARKSLVGDVTPSYIHSTALNAAFQTALNIRDDEKYITNNEPHYDTLFKNKEFFLTPARPKSVNFTNQGITSNSENYIFRVKAGEILRFQPIRVITPESKWSGFLISKNEFDVPNLKLRLGRGRAAAEIHFEILGKIDNIQEGVVSVSHVADPLNYTIVRGFLINTLPYPIVENPTIRGKYAMLGNNIIGIPNCLSAM